MSFTGSYTEVEPNFTPKFKKYNLLSLGHHSNKVNAALSFTSERWRFSPQRIEYNEREGWSSQSENCLLLKRTSAVHADITVMAVSKVSFFKVFCGKKAAGFQSTVLN